MDVGGGCYCVTLQKPTAVTAAVVGNFRNKNELELITARGNQLDIFSGNLKQKEKIPIFGRIECIMSCRYPGEDLDNLLVLTSKHDLAIIEFTPNGDPKTRGSFGHLMDIEGLADNMGGQKVEAEIITTCLNKAILIGLRLYEDHLKLIHWQANRKLIQPALQYCYGGNCFNVPFNDSSVTNVTFLDYARSFMDGPRFGESILAYFCQDNGRRLLKLYRVNMEGQRLTIFWERRVEKGATLLIPVPFMEYDGGGVIVVGQKSILHQQGSEHTELPIPNPTVRFSCYCHVKSENSARFLLGDKSGRLYILILEPNPQKKDAIQDLKIVFMGKISIPKCLVYLRGNAMAFVGSRLGDSQLIRLSHKPVESDPTSYLTLVDTFPNMGPINDLALVDVNGQKQIISASSKNKDGSLSIINNGGINGNKIWMGETVHALAYQQESKLIALLTSRNKKFFDQQMETVAGHSSISMSVPSAEQTFHPFATTQQTWSSTGSNQNYHGKVYNVCFLDACSFKCLKVFALKPLEIGLSIASVYLGIDKSPYFAVGTVYDVPKEENYTQGRILVFQASQTFGQRTSAGRIRLVTEREVGGAVYCMANLDNKLLCTVLGVVRVYEFNAHKDLLLRDSVFGFTNALGLKIEDNTVLVADFEKSISVLHYNPAYSSLSKIARDPSDEMAHKCEIIDQQTFLAAEKNQNLFCCEINQNEEIKKVGLYYLGEMVNVFRRIDISHKRSPTKYNRMFTNRIIYGTADGGIGAIIKLPDDVFNLLYAIEEEISNELVNCLKIDYAMYRNFSTENRNEPRIGFIDGNVLEMILDLPRGLMAQIETKIGKSTVKEAMEIVKELGKLT